MIINACHFSSFLIYGKRTRNDRRRENLNSSIVEELKENHCQNHHIHRLNVAKRSYRRPNNIHFMHFNKKSRKMKKRKPIALLLCFLSRVERENKKKFLFRSIFFSVSEEHKNHMFFSRVHLFVCAADIFSICFVFVR